MKKRNPESLHQRVTKIESDIQTLHLKHALLLDYFDALVSDMLKKAGNKKKAVKK